MCFRRHYCSESSGVGNPFSQVKVLSAAALSMVSRCSTALSSVFCNFGNRRTLAHYLSSGPPRPPTLRVPRKRKQVENPWHSSCFPILRDQVILFSSLILKMQDHLCFIIWPEFMAGKESGICFSATTQKHGNRPCQYTDLSMVICEMLWMFNCWHKTTSITESTSEL